MSIKTKPKAARPTVRPPLPQGQSGPVLCDLRDVKALTRAGASFIYSGINEGTFPPAAIQRPRYSRWLLSDVQDWIALQIKNAAQDGLAAEVVATRARNASEAALARLAMKAASQAQPGQRATAKGPLDSQGCTGKPKRAPATAAPRQ